MTVVSLFSEPLPSYRSAHPSFLKLEVAVPEILEFYPLWSEDELRSFIEEKNRDFLSPEDLITLRACFVRWQLNHH